MSVDPALLRIWLTGWSLTRGRPAPARFRDGLRVRVDWPEQRRRYVFPALSPTVGALAARIRQPWVFLKVCCEPPALAAVLPPPWRLDAPRFLMSAEAPPPSAALPPGYRLERRGEGRVTLAEVRSAEGRIVARGGLVRVGGWAIYDRIETDGGHRRRGLARAVMGALGEAADGRPGVLAATEAGRTLYAQLGWRELSPYATAVIPPG